MDGLYFRIKTEVQSPKSRKKLHNLWLFFLMFGLILQVILMLKPGPESPVQAQLDGTGILVYDEDGANANVTPHYRKWTGSDLGGELQMDANHVNTVDVNHTIIECSPTRDECIRGVLDDAGHVNVRVWDGNTSTWSNGGSAPANGDFTTSLGTTEDIHRSFDIAYENTSGDGLVVYESTSVANSTLMYRTWDGTNWSGENTLTYPTEGTVNDMVIWVELEADPGSNNILLGFQDNANLAIYGARWDGAGTWYNAALIRGTATNAIYQNFDVAWEGTSGEGMIAYTNSATSPYVDASTYVNGTGWADTSSLAGPATTGVTWIKLAGSPNNNYIAFSYSENISTTSSDYGVDMWNGSNWTSVTTPAEDTDINTFGFAPPGDIAWEQAAGADRALFAYRDGSTSDAYIRYFVFDISHPVLGADKFVAPDDDGAGTAECNLTGTDSDDNVATGGLDAAENANGPCSANNMSWENIVSGIDLNADPGSTKIMLVAEDQAADLKPEMQLWNGVDAGTWLSQTSNMGTFEIDLSTGASLAATLPTKAYDFAFKAADVIAISGTCQTYGQSANCANSETINARVNTTAVSTTGTTLSGAWVIKNVPTPPADAIITIWVGSVADGLEANAVTQYDNSGSISGVILYEEHLTIGSDDNLSLTNTEIGTYDNSVSGNEDIFFDNNAGTLTVDSVSQSSQEELYIKASNTYAPGGALNTHDIEIAGTFTGNGNTYTISGSWVNSYIFTCSTSIVTFTATSGTEAINSTGASTATFYTVNIGSGSGTATWNLGSALDVNGNLTIDYGTLAENGATNNIKLQGSLAINANGNFTNDASATFTFDGLEGVPTYWSNAATQDDLGNVVVDGILDFALTLSSSVTATQVTVTDTLSLASSGYILTLTGSGTGASRPLLVNGTLIEGTDSTVLFTGTTAVDVEDETYDNLTLAPSGGAGPTYNLGHDVSLTTITTDALTIGNGVNAVTVNATTYDHNLTVAGNFEIKASGTFTASNSASFNVGGNWLTTGTFNHGSGTVTFDATTTGKTINSGGTGVGKDFNKIVFNRATGGWTIGTNNLTALSDFTITNVNNSAAGFVVDSVILEVKGTYSIVDAETAYTTWTSATLYLNSASAYSISTTKLQAPESFSTLQVGDNTDIRMWNSGASAFSVSASGSLYSQDADYDNNGIADNGYLYIWGDYHTSLEDYWDYVTDFDGASGANRQANVRIDPSATVTVDNLDTLSITGTAGNRTTVSRQGASNGYGLVCDSGTITIQYTDFDYLDGPAGLDIRTGSTVGDIKESSFENLVGTGGTDANITVVTTVIGSVPKTLTNNTFSLGVGDKNAARTGADDPTGYWKFSGTNGEADDWNNTTSANEADPGMLRWDDSILNQAPNNPDTLDQQKDSDSSDILTGGWSDETTIKFLALADDPDATDTLYLCVEKDELGTAFSDSDDACGSGVAYSGIPVAVSVTITVTDAKEYHWQARTKDALGVYSASWVSYPDVDGNLESERDFGVDTTPPTGGTVNDGPGTDIDWNEGSLTAMEANWSGFDASVSGLYKYWAAFRRNSNGDYWNTGTSAWQGGEYWIDRGTNTTISLTSLNLNTSDGYYFSVKAQDNAGNTGSPINSDGIKVLPTLSFAINKTSIVFDPLNSSNNFLNKKDSTVTTTTNAYGGYSVYAWETQLLTSTAYPSEFIPNFSAGSYASPALWSDIQCVGALCGFGYTSSDTTIGVGEANKFGSTGNHDHGTLWAPFSLILPGDVVADYVDSIDGSTGELTDDWYNIDYKVSTLATQTSTKYYTKVTYIVTTTF